MATIQGSEVIGGAISNVASSQIVIDMSDKIHLLEPEAAPLTTFTKSLKASKECHNPKFQWLEDALLSKVITETTGFASGGTTWTGSTGDVAKVALWDLLKNVTTGEIMLVTVLASTTTLTLQRAFGTTAAAASAANQVYLVIGNANQENAGLRTIISTQKAPKTNYAQVFRTPFGFSRVVKDTEMYGEQEKPYQTRKRGIEHRTDIERQFLFGEPKEDTDSGGTAGNRWATGGLDYFIATNRKDAGGTLTYNTLLDFAQDVFRYGNKKERLCICAPVILSAVARMSNEKLLVQNEATVFGVSVFKVLTPHGNLIFVKQPLLQETAAYNERMFALDMDNIRERPFKNANTKLLMNRQAPDIDGEKHEYLTQVGLELANEQTHGILYNVSM